MSVSSGAPIRSSLRLVSHRLPPSEITRLGMNMLLPSYLLPGGGPPNFRVTALQQHAPTASTSTYLIASRPAHLKKCIQNKLLHLLIC